jgi:hypothetical protein
VFMISTRMEKLTTPNRFVAIVQQGGGPTNASKVQNERPYGVFRAHLALFDSAESRTLVAAITFRAAMRHSV